MNDPTTHAPHVVALDGVRGVALLAVLAFHFIGHGPGANAWPAWIRTPALTGWAGVDLFFVLSGFLITRILLASRGRRGALGVFYARRALRIFPPYYALVAAILTIVLIESHFHLASVEGLYFAVVAVYGTNLNIAANGWGAAVFRSIQLTHLWTLAIEEQFYLVWPLLILGLRPRVAAAVSVALVVIALLLRAESLARDVGPVAVYVLTFCRVDALALGAIVAMVPRGRLPSVSASFLAVGTAGTCAVVAWAGTIDEYARPMQSVGYTTLAIASAGLVGLCAADALPPPVATVLSSRALTRIGRYSYGAYLFHIPLRGVASLLWRSGLHRDPAALSLPSAVLTTALLTLTTLGFAMLSYHTFEQFFLRLKPTLAAAAD